MKSLLALLKEEDMMTRDVNATEEAIDIYLERQSISDSDEASYI